MPIFCSYRFLVSLFILFLFYYADIILRVIFGKSIFSATTNEVSVGKSVLVWKIALLYNQISIVVGHGVVYFMCTLTNVFAGLKGYSVIKHQEGYDMLQCKQFKSLYSYPRVYTWQHINHSNCDFQ